MRAAVLAVFAALVASPAWGQASTAEATPQERCEGGIRRADEVMTRAGRTENRDFRMRAGFAEPHLKTAKDARAAGDWRACLAALGKFRAEF